MALLTKAAILAADDRKTVEIDVPEWGGSVRLRPMTAAQRDQYDQRFAAARREGSETGVRALLVAACMVDENDKPMFTEADVLALSQKCNAPLVDLFGRCLEMNGMTPRATERIVGNSKSEQGADSPSGSVSR